jgi:cardiolipin synthase (CMP-forming)
MAEQILTVANQLTLLRMALVPFLVLCILSREFVWGLVLFAVAGATDLLDGLIARLGHQRTTLGAMMDPLADKILMTGSYVALTWGSGLVVGIPVWVTIIVLSRDVLLVLSVAAINLAFGRRVFLPSLLGKVSTGLQIATAGLVLLLNALAEPVPWLRYVYGATVGLTAASAVDYLYRGGRGSETH